MSETSLPEPDRVAGAPHPRETYVLYGHEAAERTFLDAEASGKLHHAWMITGPKGIGKATLAWRMARYLLARPADTSPGLFGEAPSSSATLDCDTEDPLIRRIEALSEPRLMLIRRGPTDDGKRLKAQISVDEVRKLNGFFGLSATDGGYRVVIVDCLDDMNTASANALLKLLEEPPKRAVLLLVCHQPSRVLPTIRSRCRTLRLSPLGPDDLGRALAAAGADTGASAALSELSNGSVGRTLALIEADGPALYSEVLATIATCPSLDRQRANRIAEAAAGRGAEARFAAIAEMLDLALARLARTGVGAPIATPIVADEADTLRRLSPDPATARAWAELQHDARSRIEHGRAVNVAPQGLILDVFLKAAEIAKAP